MNGPEGELADSCTRPEARARVTCNICGAYLSSNPLAKMLQMPQYIFTIAYDNLANAYRALCGDSTIGWLRVTQGSSFWILPETVALFVISEFRIYSLPQSSPFWFVSDDLEGASSTHTPKDMRIVYYMWGGLSCCRWRRTEEAVSQGGILRLNIFYL